MQNDILTIISDNKNSNYFLEQGFNVAHPSDPMLFRKMERANKIFIQVHLELPSDWFEHGQRLHGGYYLLQKAIDNGCEIQARLGFFNNERGYIKSDDPNIQILQSKAIPYLLPPAPNTWGKSLRCHNYIRNFQNIKASYVNQTAPPKPTIVQIIIQFFSKVVSIFLKKF